MRDDQDGVALLVQLGEELEHLVAGLLVERPGRLVGEEHGRTIGERPGDRDPLSLPAGELGGEDVRLLRDTDLLEEVQGSLPTLLARDARVEHRELDVAQHRRLREEVVLLEDEPDLLVADEREVASRESLDPLPLQRVSPRGRRVQAPQDRHQRGLSRPRRPDESQELTLLHGQVYPAQGVDGHSVTAERFRQSPRVDDRIHTLRLHFRC